MLSWNRLCFRMKGSRLLYSNELGLRLEWSRYRVGRRKPGSYRATISELADVPCVSTKPVSTCKTRIPEKSRMPRDMAGSVRNAART
jgi:hypothetical protein